jgi:alpha-L-arabinofuranosidase
VPTVSIHHGPPGRSENVLLVGATRSAGRATPAVLLSFINTSPSEAVRLSVKLAGRTPTSMAGTILTAPPVEARNETGRHDAVPLPAAQPVAPFRGAVLKGKVVQITVPARSLVVLTVHQHATAATRPVAQRRSTAM